VDCLKIFSSDDIDDSRLLTDKGRFGDYVWWVVEFAMNIFSRTVWLSVWCVGFVV